MYIIVLWPLKYSSLWQSIETSYGLASNLHIMIDNIRLIREVFYNIFTASKVGLYWVEQVLRNTTLLGPKSVH